MSFQEKSAWVMAIALSITTYMCASSVYQLSATAGELVSPNVAVIIKYTIVLIVLVVIGHIVIGAMSPKEAGADLDERERQIERKAGYVSGYVFGIGVISGLFHYVFNEHGNTLFYIVFASLVVSQIVEYIAQIVYSRTYFD